MWPDRRLVELFDIEHPLVLAPMAGFGTIELAAAVANAGGLGSIGCAAMAPELVAKSVADLRRLTEKPINVNFFCHDPVKLDAARECAWHERLLPYYRELGIDPATLPPRIDLAPFGEAACAVVEDVKPEVVSFHFGLPEPRLVDRVKSVGCKVISSATTVEEACWLEARGVDAIIAQGCEAGGHRGMFLDPDRNRAVASQAGTFALVPQINSAVCVPVIAAGGIANGSGIAAALALGAAGTQIGTAFLVCPEAATPPLHRDALLHPGRCTTIVTSVFSGRPARVLVNRFAVEINPLSDTPPEFPLPVGALSALRAVAERKGSCDFTPLWSGQAVALIRQMPAKSLMETLVTEAFKHFRELGRSPISPQPAASRGSAATG